MKNRYEFKIEDIKTVKIVSSSSDNYTTTYIRKNDRLFKIVYSAKPEEHVADKNKILVICDKCEAWNVLDKEEFYSDNFEFTCNNCHGYHEDTISEQKLTEIILSLMDEETFFEIELYINHTRII